MTKPEIQIAKEEIRKAIHSSELRAPLEALWRWDDFHSGESKKQWLQHLGPTGIVLFHQAFFAVFGERFLKAEVDAGKIAPEDFYLSTLADELHDIGEATVGDITFTDKTKKMENEEFVHALRNIQTLPLPDRSIEESEFAYRQVVVGDNAVLHYLFKARERTEYLDTALRVSTSVRAGNGMKLGRELVGEVVSYSLEKVIEYAQALPNSVGIYIAENKEAVSGMFDVARASVKPELQEKFHRAEEAWRAYEPTISLPPRSRAS